MHSTPLSSSPSSSFCLCPHKTLLMRAPLDTGARWKLVGSIWESPGDSPTTMTLQQWGVPSLTAREHPSGFAYPFPAVLSAGVLFF